MSAITEQYMHYVDLMDAMQFELAAEYLLMAAMLAEIKSRMLLPRSTEMEDDEEDPRAQLIRRLQEYERFKKAAEDIEEMPRLERDTWVGSANPPDQPRRAPTPMSICASCWWPWVKSCGGPICSRATISSERRCRPGSACRRYWKHCPGSSLCLCVAVYR